MQLKANQVESSVGLSGMLQMSGKITRVFDRKTGTTDKGSYSFQNFILTDDSGDCTVCFKNRNEILSPSDVGKSISIEASETANGVLGVKVEKESYTGKDNTPKTSIKVILTKSAKVVIEGGVSAPTTQQPAHEEPVSQPVDLDQLRKDTIALTMQAWREALKEELADILNPAYPTIMNAMILAVGRNADTLFIGKNGGKKY